MPVKKVGRPKGKKSDNKKPKKIIKRSKNLDGGAIMDFENTDYMEHENLQGGHSDGLQMSDMIQGNVLINAQNEDHFYYNMIINNLTDSSVFAIYRDVRGQTIVQNPSDYTVSVIRFAINSGLLPIFNFTPIPGNFSSGNTNLNKGSYSITLSYNGVDYQENVIFALNKFVVNNTIADYNIPPNIQNWNTINEQNFEYYQVFDYENFLDMINSAIQNAYMRIPLDAPPKVAGAPAPFLQLNRETQIINIIAHRSFDPAFVGGQSIQLYMNTDLYVFFNNFSAIQINGTNGKDFFIRIKNYGDNLITEQPQITYFQPWYSYTLYNVGDLVSYVDTIALTRFNYRSLTGANLGNNPQFSPVNWRQQGITWNIGTSYFVNETVLYNGSWYESIINANIGNQPDISPAQWSLSTPQLVIPDWNPATMYTINNVVFYQGYYYISRTNANTANIPSSSIVNWATYTGFDMFQISQEYESLYNWNDITNFVFTTSEIPIIQEFIPIQSTESQQSSNVSISSREILTDFAIASSTGFDIKEPIVFANQGEYRLINLISNTPLRKTDLQIWWTNQSNILFPIKIAPGGKFYANVKLMFRRKDYNRRNSF